MDRKLARDGVEAHARQRALQRRKEVHVAEVPRAEHRGKARARAPVAVLPVVALDGILRGRAPQSRTCTACAAGRSARPCTRALTCMLLYAMSTPT